MHGENMKLFYFFGTTPAVLRKSPLCLQLALPEGRTGTAWGLREPYNFSIGLPVRNVVWLPYYICLFLKTWKG